jgi:hypothetical protein
MSKMARLPGGRLAAAVASRLRARLRTVSRLEMENRVATGTEEAEEAQSWAGAAEQCRWSRWSEVMGSVGVI